MSRLTEAEANRLEATTDFEYTHMDGTPFVMRRGFVLSPNGLPCSSPPWGALVAVDLSTGLIKWESPLGSMPLPPGSAPAPANRGGDDFGSGDHIIAFALPPRR